MVILKGFKVMFYENLFKKKYQREKPKLEYIALKQIMRERLRLHDSEIFVSIIP